MTTSGRSTQTSFGNGFLPTPRHEGFDAGAHRGKADSLHSFAKRSTSSAAASPASRSASPASSADKMILAISGLPLLDWLPISGPVGCVLRTLAGSSAWRSTICSLTWTVSATPRGRWLFRLRASAPSTKGIASGLWPTPKAQEDGRTPEAWDEARMRGYEARKQAGTKGGPASANGSLSVAVQRAARPWPTPDVPNGGRVLPEGTSPTGMTPDGKTRQVGLENAVRMHGESAAKLNPDFVCRLMGFPDGYLDLTED